MCINIHKFHFSWHTRTVYFWHDAIVRQDGRALLLSSVKCVEFCFASGVICHSLSVFYNFIEICLYLRLFCSMNSVSLSFTNSAKEILYFPSVMAVMLVLWKLYPSFEFSHQMIHKKVSLTRSNMYVLTLHRLSVNERHHYSA